MSITWHDSTLQHISSILKANNDVIALYVFGSFTEDALEIDQWSDLDLLIIVQDDAIKNFYPMFDWLSSLGKILAYEQSNNKYQYVSKILFEENKKIDVLIVKESNVTNQIFHDKNLRLIFSKSTKMKTNINNQANSKINLYLYNLDELSNSFWYLAYTALAKTYRNDLIIGLHLTLDLYKKYLELLMWFRDKELKTNIHRIGGLYNDKVTKLHFKNSISSRVELIEMIKNVSIEFDLLAKQWDTNYISKIEVFKTGFLNFK
ncbi:aminoglycoside 6-adenylyltransferase [Candidatus Woesebacteria bacterium]|nr:aminoglycoside 6-adenylyltransferase [Candidatus Woesebacteria bacterium]